MFLNVKIIRVLYGTKYGTSDDCQWMNDFENNETTKLLMTNNIYDDDEPDEGIADDDDDDDEPLVKIDNEQFYDDFKDDYDYNCDDYDFNNELSNLNDINFDDFDWERNDEEMMIADEILERKAEEMESKLMLKIPWDSRPLISDKVNAKC